MPKCEADCQPHRGEVKHVHVTHESRDWGLFWYCDAAVEEDLERGFTVTTEEASHAE